MTQRIKAPVEAILTDIEGTTTPIAFVHEVLFPYARQRLADFCRTRAKDPAVAAALAEARAMAARPDGDTASTVELLLGWMAEDRKAGPLKTLQGLIWKSGYETGVLKGQVYPDAAVELRRWQARGLPLYVYSSGSEEAQRLIFGYSDHGDLRPLFRGYFDTRVGAKVDAASYAAIADAIRVDPPAILFLTDHAGEVAAALAAGNQVVRLDRGLPLEHFATDAASAVAGSFSVVEKQLSPGC